jgi:hypothetical protein
LNDFLTDLSQYNQVDLFSSIKKQQQNSKKKIMEKEMAIKYKKYQKFLILMEMTQTQKFHRSIFGNKKALFSCHSKRLKFEISLNYTDSGEK